MGFTPEELAEMARADAEIEAEFRWTNEELDRARELDRAAILDAMPSNQRKLAERQRAYREANREKVAERQRAIAVARKRRGYTQAALAQLLGVTSQAVSRWETGATPADWDKLIRVLPELKKATPSGANTESGAVSRKANKIHLYYRGRK